MKYIDAEKLTTIIEERKAQQDQWINRYHDPINQGISQELTEILSIINSLQQEQNMGEVSDGYHTFNELYYYRMLYNAAFFNLLPKEWVHKSKRHHDGEECFGGGWFIVMANLPTGQISNHYELKDWDLFKVPEKEFADEWDGHTPQEAAKRLYEYLQQEQDRMRYCIEYINPQYPLLDNGSLNIRHLRILDEHSAEMALTLMLSFGAKIYALYRGNVKEGKLDEWPAPMIVDADDWYSVDWLHDILDCGCTL